jgi:conjugal transfer pilus assembly protein TraE
MEISILAGKQKNLLLQRNILAGGFVITLLSNIILAGCIFTQERQTYIIPAHFNKEMLLSNKRLSISYLEEMSVFYLDLLLGLNEGNISYNTSLILRHIHPSFYNQISTFLNDEKKRYQEYRLSTHFKLTKLDVDDKSLIVQASGILISYFGNSGKSSDLVTYRIEYDYSAGVLTIKNFTIVKDTPNKDTEISIEDTKNATNKK